MGDDKEWAMYLAGELSAADARAGLAKMSDNMPPELRREYDRCWENAQKKAKAEGRQP